MGIRRQPTAGRGAAAVLALGALCAGCGPPEPSSPGQPRIRLETARESAHYGSLEVVGLGAGMLEELRRLPLSQRDWEQAFPIYVGSTLPASRELPPVLGSYALEADGVRFRPRFPLRAGQPYTAAWRSPAAPAPRGFETTAVVALPEPSVDATRPTRVAHVYPSSDALPANQLKLYIHFSAPMSRGEAHRHLRLYAEDGRQVPAPFALLDRELWDPEARRLTLFFDPGRIKRGVGPNAEVGPPLEEGRSYRLHIDGAWRDAEGRPLAASHEKRFRAVAPDRTQPDPDSWQLEPPATPGGALALHFPEPLDHALLERQLRVVDSRERAVPGDARLSDHERHWAFTPHAGWQSGAYSVRVDPALEDLAGNSLRRPFETQVDDQPGERERTTAVRLPFRAHFRPRADDPGHRARSQVAPRAE